MVSYYLLLLPLTLSAVNGSGPSLVNQIASLRLRVDRKPHQHPASKTTRDSKKGDYVLLKPPKPPMPNQNQSTQEQQKPGTWFRQRMPTSKQEQLVEQPNNVDQSDQNTERAHRLHQMNKKTLVSELTKSFSDHLLIKGNQEIHTVRLLKACKRLEKVMRKVGQRANAVELLRNIHKIEAVYKDAPPQDRETVKGLLLYEKNTLGIHGPGGLLKDPSAAVGLFWLRRSVEFQYKLYGYIITPLKKETLSKGTNTKGNDEHNSNMNNGPLYMDATKASLLAYSKTLESNHGWKLKRVYMLALKASTPSRTEMLCSLSGYKPPVAKVSSKGSSRPHGTKRGHKSSSTRSRGKPDTSFFGDEEEKIMERDLKQLLHVWKPLLARWKSTFVSLDLEEKRRV